MEHEEARRLAQTGYQRLIEVVDQLTPDEFTALPTAQVGTSLQCSVMCWACWNTTPVAGGNYTHGTGGPHLQLDAVEFCRVLSGRGTGDGLLAQQVPF